MHILQFLISVEVVMYKFEALMRREFLVDDCQALSNCSKSSVCVLQAGPVAAAACLPSTASISEAYCWFCFEPWSQILLAKAISGPK